MHRSRKPQFEPMLIPSSAKAHIVLKNTLNRRPDVVRVFQRLALDDRVVFLEPIATEMTSFAAMMDTYENFQLRGIGFAGDKVTQIVPQRAINGVTAT